MPFSWGKISSKGFGIRSLGGGERGGGVGGV